MRSQNATSLTLENEALSLAVVPEFGGKIVSLKNRKSNREWLWHHPTLSLCPPEEPSGYHDSGGHDECFPTVEQCDLPRSNGQTVAVLDHGELWPLAWTVNNHDVDTPDGALLDMHIDVEKLRCRFRRRMVLPPGKAPLRIEYEVQNHAEEPLPFLWAGHTLVKLEGGMKLLFPDNATARVEIVLGPWPGGEKGLYPFRGLPGVAEIPDPSSNGFAGYCLKAFVENLSEGWAALRAPNGEEFRFLFAPSELHSVALWLNCRGWAGTGPDPYFNLGFEPMIGAGDSLVAEMKRGAPTGTVPPKGKAGWSVQIQLS